MEVRGERQTFPFLVEFSLFRLFLILFLSVSEAFPLGSGGGA